MWNGSLVTPVGQSLLTLKNPKTGLDHRVHFIVVDNTLDNLLGAVTLERLNLITINNDNFIANISTDSMKPAPKLGDLGTATLFVDPSVQPKILPCRRIPEAKEKRVIDKLHQMVDCDILEPIDIPTEWVSQMACVERSDKDDIRICLDPGPGFYNKMNERLLI